MRPGESPEDALISEIGLEYRSTKPSPELYVEVLNNKDLTLSTNGGLMGFANESAIVFDGGGTLNFSETERVTRLSISFKEANRPMGKMP